MASVWEMEATKSQFEGDSFPIPPAGNSGGVLVAMVDLGTQDTSYQGEAKQTHQLYLVWELTRKKIPGYKDRNHQIGKVYTASLNEKAGLRKMVEGWIGRKLQEGEKFALKGLLGQPCMVQIQHNAGKNDPKKTYASISAIAQVPEGLDVAQPQTTPFLWDMETGDLAQLKDLPRIFGQPVADVVALSKEARGRTLKDSAAGENEKGDAYEPPASSSGPSDDEIPF